MELVKIIDENPFDPTPKLKSSPIPIEFISFNENDSECIFCEEEYISPLFSTLQKYCKKCLSDYLTNITNINIYLDVYYTTNLECNHGYEIITKESQNIQECCRNCLKILIFKQLSPEYILPAFFVNSKHDHNLYNKMIESEKYCKLCEKSLYQGTNTYYETGKIKLCLECYLISSEYMESALTKKLIPIIYLSWWYYTPYCIGCNKSLIFTSDCQKYCGDCLIYYIGCRYCLTTNIIFGLTTTTQCKKCKRVSSIIFDITSILSGNSELDEFLINLNPDIYSNLRIDEFSDKIKNNDKYFLPSKIILTIRTMCQNYKNTQSKILMDQSERSIEWIPYSQFTNVVEIAKGEFCIIYHATWNQQSVILKKFKNFQDTSKYFLDELKSNCYEVRNHKIRIHDVTKDLKVGDYLLVTQYASGGILHKWFESEFSNYLQYNEMNPKFMIFGSTPILRSSPIPIKFISFNKDDIKCIYCEEEYAKAVFSISQRYCKKCLSSYLINISDINIYLDVYILTQNGEHETSITKKSQDIQGCRNFLDILCFKQIPADDFYLSNSGMIELNLYKNMIENEKFCKLCGETLYEGTNITEIRQFILCSNCYLISTGHIDSISSKKPILVIYLPWWHNISCCVACSTSLTYASDCQKYCEICLIFYIGCRYCLTTNIIFGLTIQSQCMKCERISSIIMSENSEFLLSLSFDICNNLRMEEFSDKIKNNDKYFLPSKVNSTIHSICQNYKITQSKVLMDKSEKLIEWIPYFQFTNVVEIAKGEFGIIYRATWMGENVILKKFKNSQDASKYFLNEVRIMLTPNFYEIKHHFIKIRGVTKDSNYILVMQYASEDLNNWFMSQKENSISYVKNYKYVEISNSSQNEIDHIKFLFLSPTPKLKPSLIPIKFISFNENDYNCDYCGEEYTKALFSMSQGCRQRYCKKCLSSYLTNITEINIYLDIRIFTRNLKCNEHEISGTKESQNIQECCRNCLDILFFKQIPVDDFYWNNPSMIEDSLYDDLDKNEEICELCGKSLYQETNIIGMIQSKLCSGCYLISAGYMVSISTKKHIPVINLPWWHNISSCVACNKSLIFASDCQKYCENCLIFYIGCRYCLTTNIIFGITIQSQCKKCERISSIIVEILSGNNDLDDFIINLRPDIYNNLKMDEFSDKIKNNDTYFLPSEINSTIQSICQNYKDTQSKDQSEKLMEWIPYSQFTNVEEIAKGGFGIIYRATWVQENVILKKFKNSQDTSKYFLNELKSNQNCYEIKHHIIRTHGITKNPELGDYMLVMQYASGGDLHNWLQNKFEEIKWNKDKLIILWQISEGLETIHKSDYIHRDFHSGNILYDLLHNSSKFKERHQWLIGDLGLSQPANDTSNNEIYGVIPYIAPEIFKGSSFSKESDVYSMGMIMWELTTGCKPFANVEHDINLILRILDGERPEITEDTPGCYADLMKSCWDPDPKQRPSAKMIRNTFGSWSFRNKNNDIFDNAELKRNELLKSEKLGPEFAKKPHPKAIYTSRSLSPFISKCSSINSSLSISSCIKQGDRYTSTEQDLDIDIDSARHSNVIYPIRSLNVAITSKKRNIEESNVEIHDNSGKHIKTNSSYPKET